MMTPLEIGKKMLTQMRSWAMARFPREEAMWRGVLSSRGLTTLFTSSELQWASTNETAFTSDLVNDYQWNGQSGIIKAD